MMWLFLATGFFGAMTLVCLTRLLAGWLGLRPCIRVLHSPKGGCADAIVGELKKARRDILMQAYAFTSKEIADALVEAKARGVNVEILLDRSNEQDTFGELSKMIEGGVIPQIDAQHAMAHNKVILIDGRTVITGSFDFTHQAESENAENLLIFRGHSEVLEAYKKNFVEHRAHCQAPKVKPTLLAA